MIPFIDLKRQYSAIKPEIDSAIGRVIESGRFVLGEQVNGFEKEFASYCGTKFSVGVANGTEALQIALLAAGIKPGDEVISVANTASATITAIKAAKARPVLVDVQEDCFTMNPGLIEQAISKKTRAIIPVHLFGQCCDMKPVLEIAEKRDLMVIEDACQAHGALYRGKKAGSIAEIGCFSFYPTKNLGCYGDGGAITTSNAEIAEKIRLLRNYGWRENYNSEINGINSRLDEMQAAILRAKLRHLDNWNARRKEIAKRYCGELKTVQVPAEKSYASHVYHLYVVKSGKRNLLGSFLKGKGIASLVHYPVPIYLQQAFKDAVIAGKLKATEKLSKEILSIPIFPELEDSEVEEVIEAINSFR
ncbi:MAG: DegT/DnrJ/EryC1/StrS family aminotransferase [archaeon]